MSTIGFPSKKRLLTPGDFRRVFQEGRRRTGRHFTFITCPNQLSYSRLGLAIGKRQVPLATKRNYIRRIIRESFRIQSLPSLDIVVIATSAIERHKVRMWQELYQHWRALQSNRSLALSDCIATS